jgi:hypothetical protein
MSHEYGDLLNDYLSDRQAMDEEWELQTSEVVGSFKTERLRSYYVAHPEVAKGAVEALAYGRRLLADGHPRAAIIFAGTAIELGYKVVLLKPIVAGLVHTEAFAEIVADMAAKTTGLDRFREMLTEIMEQFSGLDLKTFTRPGAKGTLWSEMTRVNDERNNIVHKGIECDVDTAHDALAVAPALLETLIPKALRGLGLQLKKDKISGI